MATSKRQAEIEKLEDRFWQTIVDKDADSATELLADKAIMVSGHGAMEFDHDGYRSMLSDDASYDLLSYELSGTKVLFPTDDVAIATYKASQSTELDGTKTDMEAFFSSTWVRIDGDWKCVAHTESTSDA